MISSAALPKEALSKPPRVLPTRSDRLSVARPITAARGMMARQEQANTHAAGACCQWSTSVTGMKTNSTHKRLPQLNPRRDVAWLMDRPGTFYQDNDIGRATLRKIARGFPSVWNGKV